MLRGELGANGANLQLLSFVVILTFIAAMRNKIVAPSLYPCVLFILSSHFVEFCRHSFYQLEQNKFFNVFLVFLCKDARQGHKEKILHEQQQQQAIAFLEPFVIHA